MQTESNYRIADTELRLRRGVQKLLNLFTVIQTKEPINDGLFCVCTDTEYTEP